MSNDEMQVHYPVDYGYCSCGVLCETGTRFQKHLREVQSEAEDVPCPVCGCEERHPGTGMLSCECPEPKPPVRNEFDGLLERIEARAKETDSISVACAYRWCAMDLRAVLAELKKSN